jgi:hypothetical protein
MVMKKINLYLLCYLLLSVGCKSNSVLLDSNQIKQIRCYSGDWIRTYKVSQRYATFKEAYYAQETIITNRDTIAWIVKELQQVKKSKLTTKIWQYPDIRAGVEIDMNSGIVDTLSISNSYRLIYKSNIYEMNWTLFKLFNLKYIDLDPKTNLKKRYRRSTKFYLKWHREQLRKKERK